MASRFECRDAQEPRTEFKGLDILRKEEKILVSQAAYSANLKISDEKTKFPKLELDRFLTDPEISELRSVAGKLAWLAVGTSPLSAFQASVVLQRNNQQKKPTLRTLEDTTRSLLFAKQSQSAELAYTALEEDTIHIRLYTDGSFQNLETKHSQIGFVIGIADRHDSFNLVHWHSSRAPRSPCSTEQSELLALDIGLRSLGNIRTIIFGLLKREVPVVTYINCQTLWSNLMNETVPTIPEVGYRCREHITEGKISSECLIPSDSNPADALTKAKPNKQLARTLSSNHCCAPVKRVFMLQDSPHRHLTWIPTMRVPMPDDSMDGMGNHCNNCTE